MLLKEKQSVNKKINLSEETLHLAKGDEKLGSDAF